MLVGQSTATADSPPVLAFYYAWFDEHSWERGETADLPVQPYVSADPATIERQVSQALQAGISAFVQSWYGPQTENNQTETNFRTLLDVAAQKGFYAAVDFEVTSPFFSDIADVQNGLTALLATHVRHPAYFRFNGKPVIFFWRQDRYSVDTWASIRQAVDPNHDTIWIAEGTNLDYLQVFDGNHLYSIAWAANPAAELNKWPPRIQNISAQQGVHKLWVATTMPGYDDTHIPGRVPPLAVPRENGAYFRRTFQAALATAPDMLIITSFNEWLEGSQIEPSISYGDFYLNLAHELISTAAQPTATATPTPVPPSPTPTATTPPTATATATATPTVTPTPNPYISAIRRALLYRWRLHIYLRQFRRFF